MMIRFLRLTAASIRKWVMVLRNRLRYPWVSSQFIKIHPDIENALSGIVDLDIDEGIIVPLVEYAENGFYIIRMKHPTMEKMGISPKVPGRLDLITDPEVWEHEFVELTIREILHKKLREDSGSSWGDKPGTIPTFVYNLPTGEHPVAHILSALFTVSGYGNNLRTSPKEYAELLPWRRRD